MCEAAAIAGQNNATSRALRNQLNPSETLTFSRTAPKVAVQKGSRGPATSSVYVRQRALRWPTLSCCVHGTPLSCDYSA